MNQRSIIGLNAIALWKDLLQTLSPKHIFLVRGHGSFEACGAKAIMNEVVNKLNCQVTEFMDFSVNPKYDEAEVGAKLLDSSKADLIIAIGGGSVMDMAKLIRHIAHSNGTFIPLHALPTTAGTGAEATHFAVAYIQGVKNSIEDDDILPDVAIVYPPFTYGNSPYLTACTGFDALAQACEAFWNRNATPESDEFALKAIALLHKQLPACIQQPVAELRDALAEGAYWAGRAINITKTTAPHAFSYAFTSHCDYPHGHAVALTFPFFAYLNMRDNAKNLLFHQALNVADDVDLYLYFSDYTQNLGLNFKGVGNFDLMDLLNKVNLQRLANNPVQVTSKEIISLYERLTGQNIR